MTQNNHHLKAALFDLDGTLVDSRDVFDIAMRQMIKERLGISLPEGWVFPHMGTPTELVLEKVTTPQKARELARDVVAYFMPLFKEHLHTYEGVVDALKKLKDNGLKIAVVTAQNSKELAAARPSLEIAQYIDAWVTSDMASAPKPDPAPVRVALGMLDADVHEAVMIGDMPKDLAAGRNAGVKVGAALWGAHDPASLLAYKPEYTFYHPKELLGLLK